MKHYLLFFAIYSSLILKSNAQKASHSNFLDDSLKNWSYNFQLTVINQSHNKFHAAYSGLNSLNNNSESATSLTTTLFLGRKLWNGASVFFNPEVAGGTGVSATHGIGDFTNGETFRIGNPAPAVYIARFFLRQHINFNGDKENVKEALNQCNETLSNHRLVFTAGKLSLADIFDNNGVSHDPRYDFLNWGLMNNGAWDYPANTRGYTYSFITEYYRRNWVFRGSIALVATTANGPALDWNLTKAQGLTFEAERLFKIGKRAGKIKLLLFRNNSKASSYQSVINQFNATGDINTLNVYNSNQYHGLKYGIGLNFEQEITDDISAFGRIGWNDGNTATWAFTEIDQTISAGLKTNGKEWKRPNDNFGVAGVISGISQGHRQFLNLGGYGFMIGDGKLVHYGNEGAIEVFYSAHVVNSLYLTADYQFVNNPGYNKDRGPVHLFAFRVHFKFK